MTEKRFYVAESNLIDGYCVFDREKKYAFHPRPRKADCLNDAHTLNGLHEENQKQKTTIRMLEQQSQRQINRNDRLHKDWDRLYQHLLDMGLMTDEEILKVIE